LPAEDAIVLSKPSQTKARAFKIAAPMLSRIANFDDADPLKLEPDVSFDWVPPGQAIPRDADVIILFGTKSTIGDLAFLKSQGWDHDILAHARSGGRVLGICGGYQLLGRRIADPNGVDGAPGSAAGLGLLDVETVMTGDKTVTPVQGVCAETGTALTGYEIHMGRTDGPDTFRPFAKIDGQADGARSADGRIEGTYVHGAFAEDAFRRAWLTQLGATSDVSMTYGREVERALNALADGVERSADVDGLLALARAPIWTPRTS